MTLFAGMRNVRLEAARWIVNAEARRDDQGRIKLYPLPSNDGGGSIEYAGLNDRYHPVVLAQIRSLVSQGKHKEAEQRAILYVAQYTDVVMAWGRVAALEFFLRDCALNRGPKGALRILQLAAGVADDGKFGPVTKGAVASRSLFPDRLLDDLRQARESYERRVAPPVGGRAKFWPGLVNRWEACLKESKTYL